jgi:hypothetical protein
MPGGRALKTPSLAFFISLSIASAGLSVGPALADHAVGDTTGASLLGSPPNLTAIDPSGGSARISYDFAIPPGRAGLQPHSHRTRLSAHPKQAHYSTYYASISETNIVRGTGSTGFDATV